jgi:ATP phosphoribosyltransferase regulatory subunit HisZ
MKRCPGQRPWAFWKWNAPKKERLLLGETSWPAPTFGRTKDKLLTAPVWESDFEYLRRCGELLAGEEARAKVAFSNSLEIRDKKIHEHAEKKRNLHKGSLLAESTHLNSI